MISLKGTTREGADASGNAAGGPASGGQAAASVIKTNLEPDGMGKVGGLDVGWLNARSSKVERDMEAELWTGMRKHLESVVEGRLLAGKGDAVGEGEGEVGEGDVSMQG